MFFLTRFIYTLKRYVLINGGSTFFKIKNDERKWRLFHKFGENYIYFRVKSIMQKLLKFDPKKLEYIIYNYLF